MVRLVYGDRIGIGTNLRTSATSIIFDETRENVLLMRRSDNGRWCLPGGGMDPGESAEEACIRETLEETGLEVRVTRLVGIYTSPHQVIEYEDGNRWQSIAMNFEAEVTGGELKINDEAFELQYCPVDSLDALDLMENQPERIKDAWENLPSAIIK